MEVTEWNHFIDRSLLDRLYFTLGDLRSERAFPISDLNVNMMAGEQVRYTLM